MLGQLLYVLINSVGCLPLTELVPPLLLDVLINSVGCLPTELVPPLLLDVLINSVGCLPLTELVPPIQQLLNGPCTTGPSLARPGNASKLASSRTTNTVTYSFTSLNDLFYTYQLFCLRSLLMIVIYILPKTSHVHA